MKAITLWNPHATLMMIDKKRVETRGWSTDLRGLLAIHAAQRPLTRLERSHIYNREPFVSTLTAAGYSLHELIYGAVLCVRELIDIRPIGKKRGEYWPDTELELAFGLYKPGRFAWMFNDYLRVCPKPIYMPGARKLWDIATEDYAGQW